MKKKLTKKQRALLDFILEESEQGYKANVYTKSPDDSHQVYSRKTLVSLERNKLIQFAAMPRHQGVKGYLAWDSDLDVDDLRIRPRRVRGKDLKKGDTIEVWWTSRGPEGRLKLDSHRDTITGLKPYKGPLEAVYAKGGGASIASFMLNSGTMIVDHSIWFLVFDA